MNKHYRQGGMSMTISRQASTLLGSPERVHKLRDELFKMMEAMGARWAYVGRRWRSLTIEISHPEGWTVRGVIL